MQPDRKFKKWRKNNWLLAFFLFLTNGFYPANTSSGTALIRKHLTALTKTGSVPPEFSIFMEPKTGYCRSKMSVPTAELLTADI